MSGAPEEPRSQEGGAATGCSEAERDSEAERAAQVLRFPDPQHRVVESYDAI